MRYRENTVYQKVGGSKGGSLSGLRARGGGVVVVVVRLLYSLLARSPAPTLLQISEEISMGPGKA